MDRPYTVNELILMLGLVASQFKNERSLPKALGTCLINHTDSFNSSLEFISIFLFFSDSEDKPADPNIIYEELDDEASSSDRDVSNAALLARRTFSIVIFLSKAYITPMLPRSAYREIKRKDPGSEQVGLQYRAKSAVEGERGHARTVIRWATLSDQGPRNKGPCTIQVRRTPEVTAMSRNLTHGPK
ncbi:hypothetical protein H5410_028051 [Solanum commersonii]|uniref:Uncharacterized protein n=1 Tax=Solanum commersonii TaxID=4109 RepID=A0A9J5Z3V5_SOLCO|nr:hypothetical protein H5410_028051 [Solanum commersonii]